MSRRTTISRRTDIHRAGSEAWLDCGGDPVDIPAEMIATWAAMLAEATAPKSKASRSGSSEAKTALHTSQVFDALEANCGEVLQLRPYAKASMGRFAKVLAGIAGLEAADLDRVIAWIHGGGLEWFTAKGIPITWAYVVKEFPQWVAKARAWEGNQQVTPSGQGNWR